MPGINNEHSQKQVYGLFYYTYQLKSRSEPAWQSGIGTSDTYFNYLFHLPPSFLYRTFALCLLPNSSIEPLPSAFSLIPPLHLCALAFFLIPLSHLCPLPSPSFLCCTFALCLLPHSFSLSSLTPCSLPSPLWHLYSLAFSLIPLLHLCPLPSPSFLYHTFALCLLPHSSITPLPSTFSLIPLLHICPLPSPSFLYHTFALCLLPHSSIYLKKMKML